MVLAVSVRFDFVDVKSKTSFTKIRVPTGFSIAQYIEFGQAAAQLLGDISQARVTAVSLTFGIDISGLGLKSAAAVLSDVFEKARTSFNTILTGFRAKLSLPTWDESLTTVGSDAVDQADPAVASWIAAMEDGIVVTGTTIKPCDQRENDITSISFMREVHRKKN